MTDTRIYPPITRASATRRLVLALFIGAALAAGLTTAVPSADAKTVASCTAKRQGTASGVSQPQAKGLCAAVLRGKGQQLYGRYFAGLTGFAAKCLQVKPGGLDAWQCNCSAHLCRRPFSSTPGQS